MPLVPFGSNRKMKGKDRRNIKSGRMPSRSDAGTPAATNAGNGAGNPQPIDPGFGVNSYDQNHIEAVNDMITPIGRLQPMNQAHGAKRKNTKPRVRP